MRRINKGKSAFRYELAIDIIEGNLVRIEGPYPAGKYPDITIFRLGIKHDLDPNERVLADKGYVGDWRSSGVYKVSKLPNSPRTPSSNAGLRDEAA